MTTSRKEGVENDWMERFATLQDLLGRATMSTESSRALSEALNELQVAMEQLQEQNEEILASRIKVYEANRRYRELFDFAPDGYLETDTNGVIVEANQAAAGLLGVTSKHLAGKPLIVFLPQRFRSQFQVQLGLIGPNEGLQDWQLFLAPPGGVEIPVSMTIVPKDGGTGSGARLRWAMRDERERARLENEVSAERDRFIQMVEAMPAAFLSIGPDWVIRYVNVAAEQMIAQTRDDLVGKVLWDVFPSAVGGPFDVIGRRVLATRTGERFEVALEDGEVWIEGRAYPIDDGVAATFQDITDRKESVKASQLLASIVEGSGDAIFGRRADGTVTSWNASAEKLFGFTAEEMIGNQIDVMIPDDKVGEEDHIVSKMREGERIRQLDTTRRRKDGSIAEVSMTVSPLRDQGALAGFSTIARDIGARRNLERQQEEMSRDRSLFISRAAHELRSPLTAIIGFVLTLARNRDKMTAAEINESFHWIQAAAERLELLIENLLDLSNLEQGEISSHAEMVDVADVVREAIATAPAPEDVDVLVAIPPSLIATADPTWLGQTITNLLTNAYKYGGPHVAVTAKADGESVELTVSDDGQGVPDTFVGSLFDPFTRGSNRGTQSGSGLGLAIVRRALEAFGASVRYEAVEPHGSRFVVQLPRAG